MKRKLLSVMLCLALLVTFTGFSATTVMADEGPATYFEVYIQYTDSDPILVHTYTQAEFAALGDGNTYYYKGVDSWPCDRHGRAQGVLLSTLIADAQQYNSDISFASGETIKTYATDDYVTVMTYDYLLGTPRYYYPNYYYNPSTGIDVRDLSGAVAVDPIFAVISYQDRHLTRAELDAIPMDAERSYRLFFGMTESEATNGEPATCNKWSYYIYRVDFLVNTTAPVDEPDLVVTSKSEAWVDEGAGTYNVTYTVKNQGTAGAAASTTEVDVDGSPTTYSCPALALGESDTNTVGPFTISDDSDTITVTADIGEAVDESNEANNSLENTFPGDEETSGSVELNGELDDGYVSITVPDSLEIGLERGASNYVESSVEIGGNIPWQLNVEDEKTDNRGHMVSTLSDVLANPMIVNHGATEVDLSTDGGGTLATGAGPETVAVGFTQVVEYTDVPGEYDITVTFTVFGTF